MSAYEWIVVDSDNKILFNVEQNHQSSYKNGHRGIWDYKWNYYYFITNESYIIKLPITNVIGICY